MGRIRHHIFCTHSTHLTLKRCKHCYFSEFLKMYKCISVKQLHRATFIMIIVNYYCYHYYCCCCWENVFYPTLLIITVFYLFYQCLQDPLKFQQGVMEQSFLHPRIIKMDTVVQWLNLLPHQKANALILPTQANGNQMCACFCQQLSGLR